MMLSKEVHNFAEKDAEQIAQSLKNVKYLSHTLDKSDSVIDRMPPDRIFSVRVQCLFKTLDKTYRLCWKYIVDDEVQIDPDLNMLVMSLSKAIYGEGKMKLHYSRIDEDGVRKELSDTDVGAATRIKASKAIMAADEEDDIIVDDLDLPEDLPSSDGEFADDIDDLSDQVDDIQDSLDDMVEDQPTIEIDNNISGHYIAECDNCHGIFISALMESDQKVDSISGICPLCEKESDALIKWIVKDVERDDN